MARRSSSQPLYPAISLLTRGIFLSEVKILAKIAAATKSLKDRLIFENFQEMRNELFFA